MLDLDAFLPYRLNVLAKRISRELSRHYGDRFGIGIPEWRVLAVLGRDQPLSSHELVERTQMDKAKVSRAVAQLVEAGRVERAEDPADRRLLRLSLTADGDALYRRIAPLALEWQRQMLEVLSTEEQGRLMELIDRLEGRVREMAGE